MDKHNRDDLGSASQADLLLESLVEMSTILFGRNLDIVRRTLTASDLIFDDCRCNGGWNSLWPLEIGKDSAVARGPNGETLTFGVTCDEGSTALQLQGRAGRFVPVCCWEDTLKVNFQWPTVTTRSMRLPKDWLEVSSRQQELAHALGGPSRLKGKPEYTMSAEMGFVATSTERNGRRYNIQIFAKSRFTGPAIVELQFLDQDGEVVNLTENDTDSRSTVTPNLVVFREMRVAPETDEAQFVIGALGDNLVEASCGWLIPVKLPQVRKCRIVVRPITPDEALRLSRAAEPIPFLGDDTTGYTATRRKSGLALGNLLQSSEGGFLLGVADRERLLERLKTFVNSSEWQAVLSGRNGLEQSSDAIDAILNSAERGMPSPLLQVGNDADALAYLLKIFWKQKSERHRSSANSRMKCETELGDEFQLSEFDGTGSGSLENHRRWSRAKPLMDILAELNIDSFDELVREAARRLEKHITAPWHVQMRSLIIEEGFSIAEVARALGQKHGTVYAAFNRLIARLLADHEAGLIQ